MIGLDTNVLIRYIVGDDPAQSALAVKFFEANCDKETPGFISHVVLCEVTWVLKRAYGYSRKIIAGVVRQILSTDGLAVERADHAWLALREYQKGNGGFSDCLLGVTHKLQGCKVTITFDRNAAKSPFFKLLK